MSVLYGFAYIHDMQQRLTETIVYSFRNEYRVVGFSNHAAVEAGKVGAACRGEEHEIVLSLSVLSGKK